jgi:hypothetical protein
MLLAVVGVVSSGQDSHHLNVRYNLWKWHLAAFDRALVGRFLKVDNGFRASLVGKSRADLEGWFPAVRAPGASEYLQTPGDILPRYPGFLWIVDDLWAVDVVEGRVRELLLTKG